MTTRDWLLADSPTSRMQANAGRAYRVFTALLRNPLSVLGGIIILVLLLTAAFAPWIAPYSPTGQNLSARLLPPRPPALASRTPAAALPARTERRSCARSPRARRRSSRARRRTQTSASRAS